MFFFSTLGSAVCAEGIKKSEDSKRNENAIDKNGVWRQVGNQHERPEGFKRFLNEPKKRGENWNYVENQNNRQEEWKRFMENEDDVDKRGTNWKYVNSQQHPTAQWKKRLAGMYFPPP